MANLVNVLLIGGGGREHSLAWKLKQSKRLGTLWASHTENPGIGSLAKQMDVPYDPERPFRMQRFCEKNNLGLVVIGPEEPPAIGLADALLVPTEPVAGGKAKNPAARVVFGPTKDAARLEADKAWARQMMHTAAVPIADGRAFTDFDSAKRYLESKEAPYVVKASGLAKGKGVIVPNSMEEAIAGLERIMLKKEFGDAGNTVVIEERLKGQEVSLLALVDGRNIFVLEPCQDHKRLNDGDLGPNTGGMGVFCPGGIEDDSMIDTIQRQILVPIIDTLRREGIEYRGLLYAGIMITPGGPKVLEFNVRFGDPECQAMMARLDADLIEVLVAVGTKRLHEVDIAWTPAASCCVVLAAKGYPDKPESGKPISGLDEASA
ncbi:MAG: phosphoribosylamine--glycine ligase, partial [Pyrinomonadaceae bacterium]|nr:phosphoribosylamine--glycine ligase [Phycisphaerales bacterium]